jgi:[glutamine synthetase] adenylyltransferase / [glutamine synthetase]-adenylyl-L-tyrosine phosphorylase
MHSFSFLEAITDSRILPQPFHEAKARALLDDLLQAADGYGGTPQIMEALLKDARARRVLMAVFGNSPFLSRSALRDPVFLCALMQQGPDASMAAIHKAVAVLAAADLAFPELAQQLRLRRGQAALTIALADIAGLWDLGQVTQALSAFAECVLRAAVDALLRDSAKAGEITLTEVAQPSLHCGYVIIAMGKLGAGELNYSSDIDLIILYDPERCAYRGRLDLIDYQIRFTKKLVGLLQDFTEDGYVFRVDLRLRPDPAATPIALPVEAAESYYESTGKGWERAAMIKARPVAGDIELGNGFLTNIRPFVWRKNLDYAAVRDVFDMVGLIRAHHGHADIHIPGHNIKIGTGGIREIEFFAQTHQLIAGGRDRTLRDPTTLGIISLLVGKGQLTAGAAQKLREAYIFLRTLEHRLQMIDDEQTQTLPKTAEGLRHLALFMGFESENQFTAALGGHLEFAAGQFQKLTGSDEDNSTGVRDEIGDISGDGPLRDMGFSDPARARGIIETWRTYRYRALRTQRARELLDILVPRIVTSISRTSDPDGALLRFDEFLAAMPVGVQLLSLFNANPWLLELVAEIMGTAPALAEILGRRPALLDAFLSPAFLQTFPDTGRLAEDLEYALEPARDFQDVLDITRRWGNERKFQAGVQLLQNVIDGGAAGQALSDIADTLLRALLPRVEAELAEKHGHVPGARMVLLAMGKLGGRELTFTSDLDLIFIYPDTDALSDGKSPLSAAQYFARLCQRFINALSAPTGEGSLYEVDMRLRPSGGQGPIAVSLEAFRKYHDEAAQTWEHMAWTRARLITGPEALSREVKNIIHRFISKARDPKILAHEVATMRTRIDKEFHSASIWDFKYVRGGMMDAEFLTQYLLLRDATTFPAVLSGNTIQAMQQLAGHKRLADENAHELLASLRKLRDLQQIVRLCLGENADVRNAPSALLNLMALREGADDFAGLEKQITRSEACILQNYRKIILAAAGLDEEPPVPS